MSNGKGYFSYTSRTVQSGPPSKVLSNILAKLNQNSLFELLSNQHLRNLGLNKKTPLDTKFANIFALMLFFMNIPSVSIPLG